MKDKGLVVQDLRAGSRSTSSGFYAPGGKITVLLGRNNAGKTPICRLVAGLPGPATGDVSFDGVDLRDLKPGLRPISMVYQAFVTYPHWTVFENIASPFVARPG